MDLQINEKMPLLLVIDIHFPIILFYNIEIQALKSVISICNCRSGV